MAATGIRVQPDLLSAPATAQSSKTVRQLGFWSGDHAGDMDCPGRLVRVVPARRRACGSMVQKDFDF
jgi:hypothetical protein